MDVVSFPSKQKKTKTQKTIEQIAPYYTYNPHTPYYFKHKDDWESYLTDCSDMSKANVKAKVTWMHKRLGHWWCERRKEKHTLEFYAKHYSPSAKDEDRRNPALMPYRMEYEIGSINRRLEKNWVKPPPAMASKNYWESFFYNCMDLSVLEKLDIVLVELLKYLDRKKENPQNDKGRTSCLEYLQKRKSSSPAEIKIKKRGW